MQTTAILLALIGSAAAFAPMRGAVMRTAVKSNFKVTLNDPGGVQVTLMIPSLVTTYTRSCGDVHIKLVPRAHFPSARYNKLTIQFQCAFIRLLSELNGLCRCPVAICLPMGSSVLFRG